LSGLSLAIRPPYVTQIIFYNKILIAGQTEFGTAKRKRELGIDKYQLL